MLFKFCFKPDIFFNKTKINRKIIPNSYTRVQKLFLTLYISKKRNRELFIIHPPRKMIMINSD